MTPADTPEIERKVAAQLGQRLLKILSPLRVRSLSLHDAAGELLWINQGECGAALQRLVLDAQPAFELDRQMHFLERDVEGSRALFFCTRLSSGDRSGLAIALVSSRRRPHVDQNALKERVFTTLRRFSTSEPLSGTSMASPAAADPEPSPAHEAALESARRLIEQDEELRGSLRLRPYVPLRSVSSAMRRYEIAESSVSFLEHDLSRANRLVKLLGRRGARASPVPGSFSLPLCAAAVLSSDFMPRLAPILAEANHGPETMGFTIPAAAWELHRTATLRFLEQCAEARCFVGLDEFSLLRGGFDLLRAPAVRCVRLDGRLTAEAPVDRFAHAHVAAISKAARVMGIYCIATAVKSKAAARWLAAAGIEYADRSSRAGKADATTRSLRAVKLADAG
jgi:EAL domain-containing protein (putative c-di-GMP-specific phosphodiesterase class I)